MSAEQTTTNDSVQIPQREAAHAQAVAEIQETMSALNMMVPAPAEGHQKLRHMIIQALNRWPHSRSLQVLLGTHHFLLGESGPAISLLRYSMSPQLEKPGDKFQIPNGYGNLAGAYKLNHMDDLAEECYQAALANAMNMPPGEAQNIEKANAFHGLGSLYINRGQPEKVLHYCEKALSCNPTDRFALWNKGLALLESGQFGEGFDLYDHAGFLETQGKPMDRKLKTYGGKLKRWSGEKGVTVVCYGEQGVGDEIMFFSMLPDLMKDCKVIIECDIRIEGILKQSFPGVPIYPTSDMDAPFDWLKDHPDCTHYIPCGSLGRYYRRKREDFPGTPYFHAEPWRVQRWCDVVADMPRPRIGLSWAGGLPKTRMDKRSLPLKAFEEILKQDATFFSFQYHPQAADECAMVGAMLNKPIFHFGDANGGPGTPGYGDTAALLTHMDLVITVCTSLVHLCGALGVPTLCLTPTYRAWRYGGKSGPNYWYGSVEQINQRTEGEWGPVLETASRRVADVIARHRAETPEVEAA